MPTALQLAMDDGAEALETEAGEQFSIDGKKFKAWPVQEFIELDGRIVTVPSSVRMYSAKRCKVPEFERDAELVICETGRRVRVGDVRPADPSTGRFRFVIPAL